MAQPESPAAAQAARQRLELLAKAGADLSGSLDPDQTLRTIAASIVPQVADWCRIDLLDEQGVMQRRLAYHVDAERAERALEMAKNLRAASTTHGSMGSVVAAQRPYHGRFDTPETKADPALHLFTRTFDMRAYCIIPLLARGRVIGAMAVIQAESGRDLDEEDRALILELGRRAALALDNARLYAEAAAARAQAESANRAKDEFLAMLGHELRNPLAPIANALELMARRNSEVNVEERRIIGRQVEHLSRLIDDLLDVSRITQGKIQLQLAPLDMRAVATNAVELTRPVFGRDRNPVEVVVPDAPLRVRGDAVRLAQVLCNLLVNASKFTPADGRVTLTLGLEGDEVVVTVQDTGAGIPADLLPRVFDLFVQGRQASDRQLGGLGLGLAIVRTLVRMHGGRVTAESEGLGQGSRFTVRLPASAEPESLPAPHPNTAPAASGGRILVVDDNSDAAETLADLLRVVGYDVRCAGHANDAMKVLDDFAPDLALLDIGLPDIDGYHLAGMLRADGRTQRMPLVALTGYGRDNDRAMAMSAQFDEHLVKPVSADKLFEVLERFMPAPSAP